MVDPAPLPSFFGRFTAILQDHDDLGKTLALLREMCATIQAAAALPTELTPPLLLARLERDLRGHFAAEESASYFGTVVEEAPELAPQIAALKWQHQTMLKSTVGLAEQARDERRWPELAAPILALVVRLERHERSESVLLRQLFKPSSQVRATRDR